MVTGKLDELLRAHGLVTEIIGDSIRVATLGQTWHAAIVRELEHAVQLDVRIELWSGRWLVESVTGLGSGEPAYTDAINAFANGPFHVILDAFGHARSEQVRREPWMISGRQVTAHIGPVNVRGTRANSVAWFPQFQRFVQTSDLVTGTHWLRVYRAYSNGQPVALEVLRDNDRWPAALDALSRAAWPSGDGFISVRTFIIVRGGIDVTEIAAAMADHDDTAVIARFGEAARRAVAFVPLAFGRALLAKIGVQVEPKATIMTPAGERGLVLADDPTYRTAAEHALRIHDRGPAELFRALALRSSEVNAVNQALQAGSQPEDLVLSSPVISLPE